MPWRETGFPDSYLNSDVAKIAVCDFVTRIAADFIRTKHLDRNIGDANGGWSGPKGNGSVHLVPVEATDFDLQAAHSTSMLVGRKYYHVQVH